MKLTLSRLQSHILIFDSFDWFQKSYQTRHLPRKDVTSTVAYVQDCRLVKKLKRLLCLAVRNLNKLWCHGTSINMVLAQKGLWLRSCQKNRK
jgi:hypothetical protein